MTYRDHIEICVNSGAGPYPDCDHCRELTILPAIREAANEYRTGRSYELLLDDED